jgi:hypothetical protein
MLIQPNSGQSGLGLQFVEGSLTLAGMLVAFALPRTCDRQFRALEQSFAVLARRRGLSVLIVGLSVIVMRLALLPLMPIPLPFVTDDFSFLLSADTFLHGRLTNPTPAMWTHFETIHVTMQPTYASMYFPAVGLLLALSKIVFGHPWFGILVVTALMCATISWMLQAWVPAKWALLGGLLAVMHLGLYSYWVNTYHSAGSISGLGGALILGALPRILREVHFRHLLLMSIGVILVGFTRPYEGTLLCLPVAVRLVIWLVRGKSLPSWGALLKMTALPLALIVGAVCWLGYYDYRSFGSATTLPYTVDRATYAMAPYFIWQKPSPEPQYRHASMRRFYYMEMDGLAHAEPPLDAPRKDLWRDSLAFSRIAYFFCGFALLPVIFLLPRALLDRRTRFATISLVCLVLGLSTEVFLILHYVAPFTAVFYLLGVQAMRHLWIWGFEGERVGRALVRSSIAVCCVMAIIRPFDRILHIPLQEWPTTNWNMLWYGPDHFGVAREDVEKRLSALPGSQLAMVRYSTTHEVFDEWVYNSADIDASKVIWADDMGARGNEELLEHYKDRTAWLIQPDLSPVSVTPYRLTETAEAERDDAVQASHPPAQETAERAKRSSQRMSLMR